MKYEIHFAGELMMTCLHVTLFVFSLFCSFLMVMVVFNLKTFSTGEILFYLIVAKVRILIFVINKSIGELLNSLFGWAGLTSTKVVTMAT
jgi:hypothetical protein